MVSSRPATIGKGGKRIWCYPVEINGPRLRVRTFLAAVLLLLFYSAPFYVWNEAPFIRLHFSKGFFFLFGQPIAMAEMYHFVFLIILLVLILFLSAALWGRIWCGYACPQTIFIEHILRRIEFYIEGPALHRKANDLKKITISKISKKTLKYFLFLIVCVSFSVTLVSYFMDPLIAWQFSDTTANLVTIILTSLAMFNGTYWREQFCTLACPYARIQSAFEDPNSKSFGYDANRGEPRGKFKPDNSSAGDCIDCRLCVRVCPTSIDIRDGMNQLECLNCGRCADACDSIMINLKRPKGLIRFDSETNLNLNAAFSKNVAPLRKHVLFYFIAIFTLCGYGIFEFIERKSVGVQIFAVGQTPYFQTGNRISNLLQIKLSNQSSKIQDLKIAIENPVFRIDSPQEAKAILPGETRILPFLVSFDPNSYDGIDTNISVISQYSGEIIKIPRKFVKPGR